MTKEEMKKFLPIVQAWEEEKTIQYNFDDVWRDVDIDLDISLDDISKYRIKSEPKYRPFKTKEECWDEMQKHQPFGWIKAEKGGYFCFTMVLDDCSYDDLFKTSTFTDGTPFGINNE